MEKHDITESLPEATKSGDFTRADQLNAKAIQANLERFNLTISEFTMRIEKLEGEIAQLKNQHRQAEMERLTALAQSMGSGPTSE